jgi:predicted DNA binding CopG/RHH family protein
MGAIMKKKNELDAFEKGIEAHASDYVPLAEAKRARVETLLEKSRKTRNINIRISEYDLARIRLRSEEEGIPYQTLISSVLHKFVSDRLVDEKEILKSLKILANQES